MAATPDSDPLQTIAVDVAIIKGDVKALKKAVEGNGRESMVVRITRLETVRSTVRYGITTAVAVVSVVVAISGVAWAVISVIAKG